MDLIIALAGVYCLLTAVLIWAFGIRGFLRKFWEQPSPRVWGPALFQDYQRARAVVDRIGWKPVYLVAFEVLFIGGGLMVIGGLAHWW